MTYHLGPNPPNPIYDEWERALGPPTPAASASGSSSPPATTSEGSSSSPDSPAPSVHGITAGSNSGDSGSSSGVVIGVVAAVVVVGAVIVLLVMRSRRGARRAMSQSQLSQAPPSPEPWNLNWLLYNRRWVRRTEPFLHVVAHDVFVPDFYERLAADYRQSA